VTPDGVRIDGASSSLVVAVDFGPRIAGLIVGDRNLFASLPKDTLDTPFGRPYRLRGGHRLWVAPEEPTITYQPDDEPCAVTSAGDGLLVEAPPDGAGIAKSIAIAPTEDGSSITWSRIVGACRSPWRRGRSPSSARAAG
jgi:hypothetical protein